MVKARIFDFTLFFLSIIIIYFSGHIIADHHSFLVALFIFWLFSCLYYDLRIIDKNGQTTIDYGINYSLSFIIFTGPLGLFIYETVYQFTVYIYRRLTKKAVSGDFLDGFYNIGSFTIAYSISYYLYKLLYPSFQNIPFGFWMLILLLVVISSIITNLLLTIVLFILGELKSVKEAIHWNLTVRTLADMGKTGFTNGLLLLFLQEGRWEMLVSLFLLNYFVSRSYMVKSQSIQNKIERDKFEQMAYNDFLTNIANRAYMDKKIADLNMTQEKIGVVVCDIDVFKEINDNYNHSVGDQVIQHFVGMLQSYLSEDDYLFRSGGDEFTLFLKNKSFEECMDVLEKTRQKILNHPATVLYNNKPITISYTASFGLYYHKVEEDVSLEKGYIRADNLLLQSKQLGKNQISSRNGLQSLTGS